MTFYAKRQKFNPLSVKVGMIFSKIPLTPNQWTYISIIPALAAAYAIAQQQFLAAAALFFVAAAIDLIDGSVARVTGRATLFGAYLDTTVDRYMEAFIVASLLFAALPQVWLPAVVWVFFYYFGSIMSTYVKAAAKEKGFVNEEIKGGILERAEKMLILFIGLILAYFDKTYLVYVLIILGIGANITALQRIRIAKRMGSRH
jgi:phosphatidylglycerophosphate synthase